MNIKGEDLQKKHFVSDAKGRDLGCLGRPKAEIAALKEKSGSKFPQPKHIYPQTNV
jgi:hypothetical protein